ncbi:sulfatase family protein [Rubinisphaera margarita]|uniref:sulfatase family protein n=1 Tax=Rubinisphaera margarita TaxID=2909586 RepID=UPI001EE7DF47|nr:sulfatase [Rubinisphaera margarita]MCG6155769.1 sulfatase [Rubinisphaera margarita]
MNCRTSTIPLIVTIFSVLAMAVAPSRAADSPPNIVLILCDNLGYGDIEPFGSEKHRTPHLNQLTKNGRKFTHFYSASGVCTPSRAALMTGCYPQRVDMAITDGAVLRPVSPIGLNPQEWTIAEHMQQAGYSTAAFGKWHLGDQPPFLPTSQGFDHYEGIPYSDDMTPREGQIWPPLPLMKNTEVVSAPVDRNLLTRDLNRAACDWIREHKDEPFFVYMPECMPGSTRAPFASDDFRGKSKNGPWGDSIEELDWSVGQVVKTLEELGLTEKTLLIWTSDNGAPRRNPEQGSNGPLGGWGYTTHEGGQRVPCIMSWPGTIPAGTECDELTTMMDFYPTFVGLSGAPLKSDARRDGHDILGLMTGKENESPYEAFYYYQMDQLQAVRAGEWKLFLPIETRPRSANDRTRQQPEQLYNVAKDPGETNDVADQHPEIVKRLTALAAKGRKMLGDRGEPSDQVRPHGIFENPQPILLQR